MAAPYNDLDSKTEEACASVISAASLSFSAVLTGVDSDENKLPNAIAKCEESASEEVKDTGIVHVKTKIIVQTSADDTTLAAHRALVASVRDLFMDSGIAATLAAAVADYHVYQVDFEGMGNFEVDKRFRSELSLDILCCATDIT